MSESQRFAEFVEWIWGRRGVDKSFHVKVVTSDSSHATEIPQPPLSLNEAKGLFRFLASKNLVATVERDDEHKGLLYSLNIVEHYKWGEVIRELKKSDFQRSWIYGKVRDWLFWIISLVIAAFLGAVIKQKVDRLGVEPKTGQSAPTVAPVADGSSDTRTDDEDHPKPDDNAPDPSKK